MSWLSSLSDNHMPPVEIREDSASKSFDDLVIEESVTSQDDYVLKNDEQTTIQPSKINSHMVMMPMDEIINIQNDIIDLKRQVNKFSSVNHRYRQHIKDLYWEIDEMMNTYDDIKKDLLQFKQYNRRENIEITGLPDNIPDNKLEVVVVSIIRRLGIYINHYDIAGCHRLKSRTNGSANVIVRFINRKHAKLCLVNRKKLSYLIEEYKGLNIVENLCPQYRSIYEQCSKLKRDNKIKHLWTYNGTIYIKLTDNRNERGKKILHENDIYYYVPYDEND